MPRLPSPNALLLGILRPALSPTKVGTRIPARMTYPFVLARGVGGSSIDPRFVGSPLVDVQVWAGTETLAETVSYDARDALLNAWLTQTVVVGVGSIGRFSDVSMPDLLPDSPKGVFRYQATYSLLTRPA